MVCKTDSIDSNTTGLRGAMEECPGILPAVPVWEVFEPNTYADTGMNFNLVARQPITDTRERKKGVQVGGDAVAGLNSDLTHTNMRGPLSGFCFADIRTKPSYTQVCAAGDLVLTIDADGWPILTTTALDFVALGLTPGQWLFVGGDTAVSRFTTMGNNGFKRVRAVTAKTLQIDKSYTDMVAEPGATKEIALYFGQFLRNERKPLIKHKTIQFERTLGSLDGLDPPQAQYITGCTFNEFTMNIPTEDIVKCDLAFIGLGQELHTQADGLKPGTRPDLVEADAYDTSNDIARMNLQVIEDGNPNPDKLFGYVTQAALTINNNATANKAVGVRGAMGVTAGIFQVGGSMTAYFTDVRAMLAIQNNADVTFDMLLRKAGGAIVIDMPLIALGGGIPQIALNEPVLLPLTQEAASGAKVDPLLNFTLGFTFFDTLPKLADTI